MHSPTLLLALAIVVTLMTFIVFSAWRLSPAIRGLREWFIAFACALLNILIFIAKPAIEPLALTLILQGLLLSTGLFALLGMYHFLEREGIPYVRTVSPAAVTLAATAGIQTLIEDPLVTFALGSLTTGGYFLWLGKLVWHPSLKRFPARNFFAIAVSLHGAFMAVRVLLITEGIPGLRFNQTGWDGPQWILIEQLIASPIFALSLLMLANEKTANELRVLAEIDSLTNLYNRGAFLKSLEQSLSFAQRSNLNLCVLVLDVDNFKNINDSYGHDVGDAVLKSVTTTILGCLRKEDVMGRLGGEEFSIYMINTDLTSALAVAERIRGKVNATPMMCRGHSVLCSISIGVTTFASGDPLDRLIRRADQAMYFAKANGRNRVEYAVNRPLTPGESRPR